jgi:hypothetical protein
MLVDFGSAVDLTNMGDGEFCPNPSNIADVRLWGDVDGAATALKDWTQRDSGWSHNIDMFGICACVHVLLFGSPIEFVRYGEEEQGKVASLGGQSVLWGNVFGTLLNYQSDDDGRTALKSLRMHIISHLEEHEEALVAALKHQAHLLAPP